MSLTSCAARGAITVAALFLIALHYSRPSPAYAKNPALSDPKAEATPESREPALLKRIAAARWRLARARAALPPVQLIRKEGLETQDFIQYAFDDGALRLCVSPGPQGGDIFAILVDTRKRRYGDFAQVASSERYATYRHGAYIVVVPLRPVGQALFDTLKSTQWAEDQLRAQLGAPSYHWHVHGAGHLGLTHVPQGLSFIGDQRGPTAPVKYQVYAGNLEAEWAMQHGALTPLALLAQLDYATLQRQDREEFANRLLSQREQIDDALANGKRSPDGRFVVGRVNFVGLANTEEVVIREGRKPERRYIAPHFTDERDYFWLNDRTIVFQAYTFHQAFYTIDAPTGVMKLAATVDVPDEAAALGNPSFVVEFGVSGPQQFWYKTSDGKTHEVPIGNPTSR